MLDWVPNTRLFAIFYIKQFGNFKLITLQDLFWALMYAVSAHQCVFYFFGIFTFQKLYIWMLCRQGCSNCLNLRNYALFIYTACMPYISILYTDLWWELTALSELVLPSDLSGIYINRYSTVMPSCNLLG